MQQVADVSALCEPPNVSDTWPSPGPGDSVCRLLAVLSMLVGLRRQVAGPDLCNLITRELGLLWPVELGDVVEDLAGASHPRRGQ